MNVTRVGNTFYLLAFIVHIIPMYDFTPWYFPYKIPCNVYMVLDIPPPTAITVEITAVNAVITSVSYILSGTDAASVDPLWTLPFEVIRCMYPFSNVFFLLIYSSIYWFLFIPLITIHPFTYVIPPTLSKKKKKLN
jgi:hypothetical protein